MCDRERRRSWRAPLPGLRAAVFALVAFLCMQKVQVRANFLPHDFIETSVRIQTIHALDGTRNSSSWFQLEGSKVPTFAVPKHALVTIPRECDSLQLAFDHQRFVTPWLKLSGSAMHRLKNPVVHVELTRSGSALTGVRGTVYGYKKNTGMAGGMEIHESKRFMSKLFQEFYDDASGSKTKRVFVKYTFRTKHETDRGMAVLVLMALGVGVAGLMALSTFLSYRRELREFYTDVVHDSMSSRALGGTEMRAGPSMRGAASSGSPAGMFQPRPAVGLWQQQQAGPKAD